MCTAVGVLCNPGLYRRFLRADINPSNMFRNATRVKGRFPRIQLSVLGKVLSRVGVGGKGSLTFQHEQVRQGAEILQILLKSHFKISDCT